MSNQLTWADVAHYYAKNHTQIGVFLDEHHTGVAILCGCDREYFLTCASADDLPALRDLSDITEEDAQEVMGLIKGRDWDAEIDGQGIDALFSDSDFSWLPRHSTNLVTYPAAFHYLISRNYNVFGVETYKPET